MSKLILFPTYLVHCPLAPAEYPRIFPRAIHEQNIAFAE